jgi:hypothetical protein
MARDHPGAAERLYRVPAFCLFPGGKEFEMTASSRDRTLAERAEKALSAAKSRETRIAVLLDWFTLVRREAERDGIVQALQHAAQNSDAVNQTLNNWFYQPLASPEEREE